jgi:dTDP-4-dehydrorhamnose reductase
MRVLVTGYSGQLGYDVVKRLEELKIDTIGVTRSNFDLIDEKRVKDFIKDYKPDVVVHCAAYTNVDKAEDEKELCYIVNVLGTKYIAEVCKDIGAKMIYISTDYVFDGEGIVPFEVKDKPNPINYYGETKYKGELEVQKILSKFFIVRISWVFGSNGNNFVKTMLRIAKEKDEIYVVDDQIGSPTYTYDLAKILVDMINTDKYGIYHVTNEGFCSWYEFAKEIFKIANIKIKVNPINTEDYPTRAKRPQNSRLSKNDSFFLLREYKDSLYEYMKILMEI